MNRGINVSTVPSEGYTHSVVFLHGAGDEVSAFSSSVKESLDSLRKAFPTFRWVFPGAAPRTFTDSPEQRVSRWFDARDNADSSEREAAQIIGLRDNVICMRDLLNGEAHELGGRWDRVILAGFDQGAGLATHTLLNLDLPTIGSSGDKLGAFIVISGRMPFPGRSLAETRRILGLYGTPDNNEVLEKTPTLLEHCVDDDVVAIEDGHVLRDTLRGFGMQVNWKEYSTGGHWFNSPTGVADLTEFLREAIPPQDLSQEFVVQDDLGQRIRDWVAEGDRRPRAFGWQDPF